MHGRSCMTIDPRIPTMPGQSTSRFDQPSRRWLVGPSAMRREVMVEASRMTGELHPT